MQQVINQGTATALKKVLPEGLTVAGKTGTTDELRLQNFPWHPHCHLLAKHLVLFQQPSLDEELLRAEGVTDFTRYRCSPEHEPSPLSIQLIDPEWTPPW